MIVILIIFSIILSILLAYLLVRSYKRIKYKQKFKQLKTELVEKINNVKLRNDITGISQKINYPVFYINMDKSTDRKIYIENMLNKFATTFYRVKGFNGYKITDKNKGEIEGIKFINYYPELNKSEIGCTISHILAIKQAYDSNNNIAIICEDDVQLDIYNLCPKLEKIIEIAPKDWEIIQLCISGSTDGSLGKLYKDRNPSLSEITFIKRNYPELNKFFWGSVINLINRKGMKKIVDTSVENNTISIIPITQNPKYPLHGVSDEYIFELAHTYSLFPSIFMTDNTQLESTIHSEHTLSHLEHSLTILTVFDKFITNKQIRFLKTLFDMDDILSKNFQQYFLACGTVLGVIRENKFIEHDEDIDLGVFASEYNQSVENEILKKFKLKHRLGDIQTGYEISFIHPETDVSIDIFLHYKEKDYYWTPSFFGICDNAKNKMCRWKYKINSIEPIIFSNRILNIPSPIEEYLIDSYGKDWRISKQFSYHEGLQGGYKNIIYSDFGKEGDIPDKYFVWQYWETKPNSIKPGYIDYSMDTIKKMCKIDNIIYIRLSPDNLHNYMDISELPKNWHKITEIAHKTDYLRAIILYKYGGLWLDADVIAVNSIKPLLLDLETSDWVVFADNKQEISIAIFATRKKSPLLKKWIEEMTKKIEQSITFSWTGISYDILYPLWKEWDKKNRGMWRRKIYKDTETCFPLQWNEWKTFFEIGDSLFLFRKFQPVIDMFNNLFPIWFKYMDRKDFEYFIKTSDLIIADLFRRVSKGRINMY
jgi:GR25 family glycosyltransferase involved in LPS biosynthesis/mannosyltransferase OCH1-like enzyme